MANVADSAPLERFDHVDIDLIHESPDNPRTNLGTLDGLIASVKEHGVLEPLVLTEGMPDGADFRLGCSDRPNYTLVAGARRLAAARQAGLAVVPSVIRSTESAPAERIELMLIENLQREDLDEFDDAAAFDRLVTEFGMKSKDVAERVGKSPAHVSKRRALLKLPDYVREAIGSGGNPITLAEAYKLTELVDDVDRLKQAFDHRKFGPAQVERAANRLIEERKNERARAKAIAELEAAGVPLVPSNYRWSSGDNTEDLEYLDIDETAHRSEPCSAAFVSARGEITWMCNDVTRHSPDGPSALKSNIEPDDEPVIEEIELQQAREEGRTEAEIAEIEQRAEAARAAREAHDAAEREMAAAAERALEQRRADTETRRAFIRNLLTSGKPTKPAVADLFAAVLVATVVDEYGGEMASCSLACELLDLEHDDSWGEKTSANIVLETWAAAGLPQRQRAGLAVALAGTEAILSRRYNNVPPTAQCDPFFEFLGLHGYELTDTDKATIEAARAAESEDQEAADRHASALAGADLTQADLDGEMLDELRGRFELACQATTSKNDAALALEARAAFADALANTHPDPELAAAGVGALIVGYRSDIGDDDGGAAGESMAYRTRLVQIIEDGRPLHAELRDEIIDGAALSFDVIADRDPRLRAEDIADAYRRRAEQQIADGLDRVTA